VSAGLWQRRTHPAPEGWRQVDHLLAQWVIAHGGSPGLADWAGAISAAEGDGHTALALDDAARYGADPATRGALDDPRWVGDGRAMTPFVREGEVRLFLWRYWQAECRAASALATRVAGQGFAVAPPDVGLAPEALAALFGHGDGTHGAAQREAVGRCGGSPLFVLTGGPGTGKTTTVLRMLLAGQAALGRPLRTRVAAPTGKAAQRLVDALRVGHSRLATLLAGSAWAETVAAFQTPEASTVHRLLGYQPRLRRYARDAANPIEADLVVIDEASMLDLETLDALLDALPARAALWLVGDAEQLSPIGPGSAFQDLVQALEQRVDHRSTMPLVRLTHSFRAEPALDGLNRAVRKGDAAALRTALATSPGTGHAPLADAEQLDAALRDWARSLGTASRFTPLPAEPGAARDAAAEALAALGERQWLCATREGGFGSLAVNARLDALLRRQGVREVPGSGNHYAGRRLLVTRNDTDTGLFNGDVGLCLADADGRLRVWFEGKDGPRALPLGALPEHEPAFALTIHKSQGSEYAEVAVLLPNEPTHRLLSRELLYTAVSRARRRVMLHASEAVLDACLGRPVQRSGGLHARLAEALAAAATGLTAMST
jgi:exodeoxyribonuclease V alpha subunit